MVVSVEKMLDEAGRHYREGRVGDSERVYRQAVEQLGDQPDAMFWIGLICCQTGRVEEGLQWLGRVVGVRPNSTEAWHNIGVALTGLARVDEAIGAYRKAIECRPGFADAPYNLGLLYLGRGALQEAAGELGRAITIRPDFAEAYANLGVVLMRMGRVDEAVGACGEAVKLRPDWAEAHFGLGQALRARGHVDGAVAAFHEAVRLRRDYADAWANLADALTLTGRTDEVITAYKKVVALRPQSAEAHYNLGVALGLEGQLKDAVAAYRKAVALKGDEALYHFNLGSALKDLGNPMGAAEAFRAAVTVKPNYPEAYNNLGIALKDAGMLEEAFAAYRKAVELKPDYADAHSNLLMGLHYWEGSTAKSLYEEHLEWARRYAEPMTRFNRPHASGGDPERRLRIGYVSGDFWSHAVARFVLPLLANHDRTKFEIFCYSNVARADAVTEHIRNLSNGWRNIFGMGDEQAAGLIRDDRVDILVDLSLHSAGNRMLVFARKPAPVQVTWLGYAGTTGTSAVDWRLTDRWLDPEGVDTRLYSEKSMHLGGCFWCYQPIPQGGDVGPLPGLAAGQVTFACLNNFAKVSEGAQELWARILAAVPGSCLMLHSHAGAHRERVLERFERRGVGRERIEFVGRLPVLEYLRCYHRLDIALDPFPFCGGTTTCDALWMGVPVVTLAGTTAVGRAGASILSSAGLGEWVADSKERYVEIAGEMAEDLPGLALLRSSLRDRVRGSALMDGNRFAREVEAAYRRMWGEWCTADGVK